MSLFDKFNLGQGFKKYFHIEAAVSLAQQDAVFGIRHEVYCEELGFEPVRPDQKERDAYDAYSFHCLLHTANEPRELVGCTRLVMANPAAPDSPLPFETTCAHTLDRSIIDPASLPRERIAEVSRLAVRAPFRRRRGEEHVEVAVSDEDFGTRQNPRFPYIPIGLYLGAIAMAEHHGIETLFVLTEPRLASHFARLRVDIRQIGGPVEHRGTRVPSMMDVRSIINGLGFLARPIWRVVREEIAMSYQQATPNQDEPT